MEEPAPAGAPAWMATFGDMMSLLLTFFVLLLSFANMDIVKFRKMAGSMKDAFGTTQDGMGAFDGGSAAPIQLETQKSQIDLDQQAAELKAAGERHDKELLSQIESAVEKASLQGLVEAVPGERGVTVRIKGTLMFSAADDKIRLGAMAMLDEIAQIAAQSSYKISIEGHTDDVPIRSSRYPTNWHLSTARAVAGLLYLIEHGNVPPSRVSAAGFAHTKPIVPGSSALARQQNRRLEFVFYRDEEVGLDVDGHELHQISIQDREALDLIFDQ